MKTVRKSFEDEAGYIGLVSMTAATIFAGNTPNVFDAVDFAEKIVAEVVNRINEPEEGDIDG